MIAELQTIQKGRVIYSDIPANFAKSNISNDLGASFDIRAIQESLAAIISTNKGERPFYPEFGCDVTNQLFENANPATAYAIKYEIQDAVQLYEPRIRLKNVVVVPEYDINEYRVSIEYHVITDTITIFTTTMNLRGGQSG